MKLPNLDIIITPADESYTFGDEVTKLAYHKYTGRLFIYARRSSYEACISQIHRQITYIRSVIKLPCLHITNTPAD